MTSTLVKSRPLNAPTIRQMTNGLTIVAERMPVEAVNLSLWVNVGSAVESDHINGMAHFLEHMVFKGTKRLQSGEFERLIEERGAIANASTSQDYTHFYITCAPKDFAQLAPLQLDIALNPSIPEDAFERERLVVLEEIRRSEDNPRRRIFQRTIELAYERLPYRRSVLGPAAVVEQLTAQQMRDFHHHYYQPPSITVSVVGNLPVEELIATVEEGFERQGSYQSGATYLPFGENINWEEPAFEEIVRQESVDNSIQQARLVMVWRVPGMGQLNQTYGLDVLSAILGQGRTSRLVQDLREERHLVNHISASNMAQKLQGLFYISAQLPVENVPEVEAAIAQHIRTIQTELVSEAELGRIRHQVANRFIFSNETPSDRANIYGYYQSMAGDLAPALNYPARIQALDAIDLRQAALKYLSPDAYGCTIVKPS
jgi:predicted Zn-dependent peptidase